MLTYRDNLGRDTYDSVDDHAHTGKGVVKKVIALLEKMSINADKDSSHASALHKLLPFIEQPTTRHAMEKLKAFALHQSDMCAGLKTSLNDGPLAEANVVLNTYRVEWPELKELAKEANTILLDLEKQEKEARKKLTKATNVEEHLQQDIEEGKERARVTSLGLAAEAFAAGHMDMGESSPTDKKSPTLSSKRHTRSKTSGGSSWFGRSKEKSKTKSLRKIEKNVSKLVGKADKVAATAKEAEKEHQHISLVLKNGTALHTTQMKEILAGFQRLEMGRSTAVRNILLECFQQHRAYYQSMLNQTDELIQHVANIDPESDTQYFIRRTRKVANPWRCMSGNVPVVTPNYHTPVSSWTTNIDEETGHPFYLHTDTRETSWTPPEHEDVPPSYIDLDWVADTRPLPSEVENQRRMEEKRTGSGAPVDAADWDAVQDDNTGQVYYYNSKTGQSSWSWPPVVDEVPVVKESVVESVTQGNWTAATQSGATPGHARTQSQPTTTSDWVLHTDEASGNQYWWNQTTQETRWAE